MLERFAVIGNPIAHSLSPTIHHYFAQQTQLSLTYEKIQGDTQAFEQQVSAFFASDGKGLNITLPFKQRAFAMAHVSTQRCQLAGAANTLWMKDNQLHADNTDGIGLLRDLSRYITLQGKRILILGAGGAARGIINPLLESQPDAVVIANRSEENMAALLADFPQINGVTLHHLSGAFDVIINATSAGLDGQFISLPAQMMSRKPFCYDLAYKQKEETPFVHYARSLGCQAVDGLGMLVEQAAEAFKIWHGVRPLTEPLLQSLTS